VLHDGNAAIHLPIVGTLPPTSNPVLTKA